MNEEESKTKWCPFARVYRDRVAVNRDRYDANQPTTLCIGSACMAWRWSAIPGQIKSISITAGIPSSVEVEKVPDDAPRTGYCGLAGAP